jgi:hypothetical protein
MLTSDHTALPSETLHSPCRPAMPTHQPTQVRGVLCDHACLRVSTRRQVQHTGRHMLFLSDFYLQPTYLSSNDECNDKGKNTRLVTAAKLQGSGARGQRWVMCYEWISHGAQGTSRLMFNFRFSMFKVQGLMIIAGPQGTSHCSGANVFHHCRGVQTTVRIML